MCSTGATATIENYGGRESQLVRSNSLASLLSSAVDTAERAKKALRMTVTSTHMATASGYTVRNLLVQNELGRISTSC